MIPVIDISAWEIIKSFVIFGELLYLVFAFVVIKQVKVMLETLDLGLALLIKAVGYGHFLFACGIIIISLVIL